MDNSFNPNLLKLARQRRKMTYKALAEGIGMSSKMLSLYEKDNAHVPTEESIKLISSTLKYPVKFFYGVDIEDVDSSTVAFRSLKSMKASQQHAAIAAGQLGVLLSEYLEKKFSLPKHDLSDFRGADDFESVAAELRYRWKLGLKGIKNIVHLLESKGVRVFSLAENTADVDAFSFWKDGTPYIFLNTRKSSERSRFDAAHELGHLILHRHRSNTGKEAEREADSFASAFLMPEVSVIEHAPRYVTISSLIKLKKIWSVSLVSLIYRMNKLTLLTEWQYRTLMMTASQKGFRTKEPEGCQREVSLLFQKIITALKVRGVEITDIANELSLPIEELTNLMFMPTIISNNNQVRTPAKSKAELKVVQ